MTEPETPQIKPKPPSPSPPERQHHSSGEMPVDRAALPILMEDGFEAEGVRVRTLDWTVVKADDRSLGKSETVVGLYQIFAHPEGNDYRLLGPHGTWHYCTSLFEAKTAAQIDYVSRIKSAFLTVGPPRAQFTDAQAAERLLNRHSREVAQRLDSKKPHAAEEMLEIPARRYLEMVIAQDKPST